MFTSGHFANSLSIALSIIGSFGTYKLQVCGMCSEIKPLFYTHRCHEKDLAISPRLVVVNALVHGIPAAWFLLGGDEQLATSAQKGCKCLYK